MSDCTHDLGRGLPGSVVYEAALAQVSGQWDTAHRAARAMAARPATGHHESAGLFRPDDAMPAGHGNFGMAHGVAGPTALLALADRAGHTVPGQLEALAVSCRLLEQWARPVTAGGAAWPEVVDRDTWLAGPKPRFRPGRPSWCYGTPGIARALQLAALACELDGTRRLAEALLEACLRDADQLTRITDPTVCHGWAGLCLAADRAAADADADSPLHRMLPGLYARLTAHLAHHAIPEGAGLLTGSDGVRLTIHTLTPSHPVASGWETCLLLK